MTTSHGERAETRPEISRRSRRPAPARRALRPVVLALSLAMVAGACGETAQDAMSPRGHYNRITFGLIKPVFVVAFVVFVFVEALIVVTVIRWRRRSDDDNPEQVHGNALLETAWTIAPAVILAVVGFLTVNTLFKLNENPKNAVRIQVVGHQWWWEYRYKDPQDPNKDAFVTANELHIPAGRNVRLELGSADVIHNFWPPKLAGKVYAIPGRENLLQIEADKPDTYFGQCAEYCGLSHANMRLRVVAMTTQDYDAWFKAQQAPPTVLDKPFGVDPATADVTQLDPETAQAVNAYKGQQAFLQLGCSGCHAITGVAVGNVGPNLTHLASRQVFAGAIFDRNDVNLRRWLSNPPAEKPGSKMPNLKLTDANITQLIAYLNTLQ